MKIRHQTPSSEMNWTVQAPLALETPTGEVVGIRAWSLAGIEWPETDVDCPQTGILTVPFQGVDVRFPVRLVPSEQSSTVSFEGLSGRQRETLALFYRSLLSGKMASSGDVITSLDTPVDLVPMGETEEEQAERPPGKLPNVLRVLVNVLFYTMVAVAIFGVLGSAVFKGATKLSVQHGRVVAPLVEHIPASEGFVKSISVSPGEAVVKGQVLVRLRNPVAEGRLSQARAKLSAAQTELLDINKALRDLTELHTVDALETRGAAVAQVYARFVGDRGFDNVWARWAVLKDRDPHTALKVDPFDFAIQRLKEIERASLSEVRTLRASRDAQKTALSLGHLRAPSDGVVHDIFVQKGQPFSPKTPALIFESKAPRVAVGWMSDRYAETIFVGMSSKVTINVGGKKQEIDATVTNVQAGNDPRRPGEFGIVVTVTPNDMSVDEVQSVLRIDAPVTIDIRRPLYQKVTNRFAWVRRGDV